MGGVRRLQDHGRPHLRRHSSLSGAIHSSQNPHSDCLSTVGFRRNKCLAQIDSWWRENQDAGRTSILFAYSLGKAQRLIAGVNAEIGPIFCHGAVQKLNEVYRESGIALPPYSGGCGRREGLRLV